MITSNPFHSFPRISWISDCKLYRNHTLIVQTACEKVDCKEEKDKVCKEEFDIDWDDLFFVYAALPGTR